jgi:RNA polymerase sigma-70 factor (ECF subfamily)
MMVPAPAPEPVTIIHDEDFDCTPIEDVVGAIGASGVLAPNWAELVARIKRRDSSGLEDLYQIFSRGIRFFLCRQLGPQELDDRVHDTFLIVVSAIQRGELREPERLMGFVRTIVRRQVAAQIDRLIHSRKEQIDMDASCRIADHTQNPEQSLASRESSDMMVRILRSLSERDREILTRFYLHEQSQDQICREMELSETQFRLLKSRAKARFGDLGKKRLQQSSLISLFVRTSAQPDH